MSATNDKITYATKEDILALSHQLDNLQSKNEEPLTAKDLKISVLELKEWANEKFNSLNLHIKLGYILFLGVFSCFSYVFYLIHDMNRDMHNVLLEIIKKLS